MEATSPTGRLLGWRVEGLRWALRGLERLQGQVGRAPKKARHLVTGERGELEALFYLRRLGYLFVERRWRSPELRGDLDLVGWEGETLCVVEVKARTARDLYPAALAVDEEKRRMLRRMGRAYLRTLPRGERRTVEVRFDVVSVYLLGEQAECELVRGAFGLVEEEREWRF